MKKAEQKIVESKHFQAALSLGFEQEVQILENQVKVLQAQSEILKYKSSDEALIINRLKEIEQEREQARKDANDLYQDIENTIALRTQELELRVKFLEDSNHHLRQENQDLRLLRSSWIATQDSTENICLKTTELDFYPNEKKGLLLDILKNSLNNVYKNSRRQHIISDIISANIIETKREVMKTDLHDLFRDYGEMNRSREKALERMGFTIVSENKHIKIVFHNDNRYTIVFAATPSDWRAGRNIASDICNLVL